MNLELITSFVYEHAMQHLELIFTLSLQMCNQITFPNTAI